MAKLPCPPQSRIYTLKDTGETMSYDQVREYLMSNPELWSGKGEQKVGPLSSVEATAKALEGLNVEELKKIGSADKEFANHVLNKFFGLNLKDENVFYNTNKEYKELYDKSEAGSITDAEGARIKELYANELKAVASKKISEAYHSAKKEGLRTELVKDVEDLLGGEPKAEATNTPEGIAARIRNKKQKGALSAIDFGISVTIYNGALEFMAAQVEKGTKLGNAIANTIKWVDDKMKGEKWNKGAFGKYMNDTYKVTLGDGREVEVVRDDSKETAEVVNGWYQPIEQKILDSKEESMPANKWAERLKSKEDEDLWTGVRAFLEEKGTERVSRQELLDFVKDNRIEIVTVVKGEGYVVRDTKADKDIKEFDDYEEAVDFVLEQRKKGNDYSVLEKDKKKSVKFEQYQLPGDKENYKEVLVTLPKKLPIPDGNYIVYTDKGAAERREYIKGFDTEKEAFDWIKENEDKYPYAIDYETRRIVESIESGDVFNSSHFDEPNILVHLRMNTRTDAEGKKVLFLEEVQSDWGQKGKKEGFKERPKELPKDFKIEPRKLNSGVGTPRDGFMVIGGDGLMKGSGTTIEEATNNALDRLTTQGQPTAPFVMDTNAWVKLGLKTALKEAVAQGADKIAWTTGEQQNDRYDLSRSYRKLSITPQTETDKYGRTEENGTYLIEGIPNKGDMSGGAAMVEIADNIPLDKIEDYVGKEIAEKVKQGQEEFEGNDLKVGGKGMKGFYGSAQEGSKGIIGGVAEKLFGQKVGETKIEGNPQSSISITPELKAQVEKGLPLFGTQLTPEQELKQAFDKWKSETGKLGIVPNWERQIQADIDLFNAAKKYLLLKIEKGAYAFEQFLKDLAIKNVENIDEDRSKWKKFYNDTIKEAAPAGKESGTPPPPATPPTEGREMPEGEGKETEKPILGRAFRGTTDEALAEKLAKMGLYRKPASIEEADKIGAETVALMGIDKAIELGVKGDVPNGFVRMGIFKAILADLKKQRDALVIKEGPAGEQAYMDALDEINDKRAEAMAAFSPSVTAAGQILRGFQEIIRNEEFEFDYEFRKDNFKTLFGDEAYTKEIDERFKEYDKKLKDAAKKRKELENRIAELEAQGIVDNINQEKKTSPVSFFKQAAERVRKLKFSRPGMFSAATPATLAWDATIEAVAVVLDASGTLEQAIAAGVKKLKTTEWYKSLTDAKKSAAENEVAKYVKDGYILKATIDEDGIIQIPSGLLRSYVTAGVNDAQAIIDDMLSYLKEADSEISASDVRTAILEAGKREAPTQNQITQSVNDLKSIIRMLGQLEKIRAGERIAKNEGKKKQMRDAVANLKKTIEDKHLEVFGTKPGALTDEQRLANIKKNAQKRISDLKAMKPRPEVRERVKWDAEMEALANEEFRLKEKWDDEFAQARYKKLSDWQKFGRGAYLGVNLSKTIMSGMTDLGIILIQGATLPFRSAKLTAKAFENMAKVILSHDEFVRQQRMINESDLYRVARKSSLDMPQVSGMEIDKLEESSLGALGEKAFDILFKPFDYIPRVGPKMYEWAKKHINIPRVLNRMQTSYLNTLRYGTFALSARSLMEKGITYQDNPQAYKDVAEAINTMSGRTKIGAENSPAVMRFLNLVFYSPKNAMSLLKIYTPYVLIEIGKKRAEASGFAGMSEAQQTMIRTLAGAIAIPSALYLMMKALTGWDEEDEEEKKKEGNISLDIENPQSSAFAKIRIGNQLFDPWGGRAQLITLQARLIIHYFGNGRAYKDPYTGIEKRLSDVQRFKHPVGLAGEYIKGKFSPYARATFTLGTSEQVKGKRWYVRRPLDGGKEFDVLDPIKESYTNITYESVKELYGNQPLTVSEIMTLFLIAGGGVTTLNNQDEQSILTKVREKLSPEEDERRKFAKNLASYIKDENMIGAEEVYDQAIGVKGNEKKSELITKRREHADKLFSSAKKDGIASKWTIDVEDRPKVFALLYKNEPIRTTPRTKQEKKVVYDAYNNLTPEEKAEIKFDYEMEYEELINIAKGLDHLNKTPGKYLKKVNQVEWVKEYKKATGKK